MSWTAKICQVFGADISQTKDKSFVDTYRGDFITDNWERATECRNTIIAPVSGYALGGGCELAMVCDLTLAGKKTQFGQPENSLGIMPGAGGTRELTPSVGKSKAMDMRLTGRRMDA